MTGSRAIMSWAGTLLLLARLAAPAGAAPADSSSAPGSHLAITEIGIATTIQSSRPGGSGVCGDLAFGYLARTGKRTMIGGEVGITTRDEGINVALRPRLRRDLDDNRSWSMNLAAGPVVYGTVDSHKLDGVGLSIAAGLDYRGYVGVRVELQRLGYQGYPAYAYPYTAKEHVTTTLVGLRLGRTPGGLTMIGLAIVTMIAMGVRDTDWIWFSGGPGLSI